MAANTAATPRCKRRTEGNVSTHDSKRRKTSRIQSRSTEKRIQQLERSTQDGTAEAYPAYPLTTLEYLKALHAELMSPEQELLPLTRETVAHMQQDMSRALEAGNIKIDELRKAYIKVLLVHNFNAQAIEESSREVAINDELQDFMLQYQAQLCQKLSATTSNPTSLRESKMTVFDAYKQRLAEVKHAESNPSQHSSTNTPQEVHAASWGSMHIDHPPSWQQTLEIPQMLFVPHRLPTLDEQVDALLRQRMDAEPAFGDHIRMLQAGYGTPAQIHQFNVTWRQEIAQSILAQRDSIPVHMRQHGHVSLPHLQSGPALSQRAPTPVSNSRDVARTELNGYLELLAHQDPHFRKLKYAVEQDGASAEQMHQWNAEAARGQRLLGSIPASEASPHVAVSMRLNFPDSAVDTTRRVSHTPADASTAELNNPPRSNGHAAAPVAGRASPALVIDLITPPRPTHTREPMTPPRPQSNAAEPVTGQAVVIDLTTPPRLAPGTKTTTSTRQYRHTQAETKRRADKDAKWKALRAAVPPLNNAGHRGLAGQLQEAANYVESIAGANGEIMRKLGITDQTLAVTAFLGGN